MIHWEDFSKEFWKKSSVPLSFLQIFFLNAKEELKKVLPKMELENSLLNMAKQQGKEVQEIILETLKKVFAEKIPQKLHYKTLDPSEHIRPFYVEIPESAEMSNPFVDVENTVKFSQQLREKAWC